VRPAAADQLSAEPYDGEVGYSAIEELSYEAFIDATDGFAARFRIRVALRNASLSPRDAVHTVALPFAAHLEGLAIARDGQWSAGVPTQVTAGSDRRDPGSVFVRPIAPRTRTDVPAAELVVFGLDPGAIVQVELSARVYPRLRGDRWELDLPARGSEIPSLAAERRILVTGLSAEQAFFVDDRSNEGRPFIVTRPTDGVTVAWPARIQSRTALEGHLEAIPGPPGFDDGDLRLFLRLGHVPAPRPDHVILVLDGSLSTPERMQADALRVSRALFSAMDPTTTFDAIAFDRYVTPLLDPSFGSARVGDPAALARLEQAVAARPRGQGTDLAGALVDAARRSRQRGAKRTLVITFTDGMFPASLRSSEVAAAIDAAAGPRHPELLFVVDEPMLASSGLSLEHPVAQLAAQLGARISLKTLAQLEARTSPELLLAPRVLGDFTADWPSNVTLVDPLPEGLVAGSFVLVRGHYVGRAPKGVRIAGRLGSRTVQRRVSAVSVSRQPSALAASLHDVATAASEGFVRPPWYRDDQGRDAERAITQAGRAGDRRRGYLDDKIFRHYLTTRVLPRARACYNRGLTRHRDQSGRVVLTLEIAKGEVMAADVSQVALERPDPQLLACLREAAWALDVPAGKLDGRIYQLRYPLRLVAPAAGKTEGSVERMSDEVMEELLRSG